MAKRSTGKRELIDTGRNKLLRSGIGRGSSRRWMMSPITDGGSSENGHDRLGSRPRRSRRPAARGEEAVTKKLNVDPIKLPGQ